MKIYACHLLHDFPKYNFFVIAPARILWPQCSNFIKSLD